MCMCLYIYQYSYCFCIIVMLRYYSIVKDKWYQHFYGILLSAIHATGAVIYVGAEILEDYKHLPDDVSLCDMPYGGKYWQGKLYW